jgi:phospho-N-acetylmuramoyl-pentapeptide-transferase
MLVWLLDTLGRQFTLRAALGGLVALGTTILLGPRVIAWLRTRKVGERIEKQDSKQLDEMMKGKKGTPTMGGVFVVTAMLVGMLFFCDLVHPVVWVFAFALLSLGAVGAVDDWLKLSGRSKTGMRMKTKLLCQVVIGLAIGVGLMFALRAAEHDPSVATRFTVPFYGEWDAGWLYPVVVMLVITATTNAVNITDGLDGLAGGCLGISTFAYAIIAYVVGRVDFSDYLHVTCIRSGAELTVVSTAMLGATLGFLWFNSHPAQVFLGDSGSLPLGGALGLLACATKQELLLFLVGGVFVIEAGSSLLQILSYKTTGRRVFLIAPLHHHFQFRGMPETKITLRFWIVAAVMAVSSLALLKLR